ncbi:MAG: hypothetical protein QM621_01730 [Aeromicrobium sp.]|uniref:hypothetical protein n=1 Tax=Aeromicrobium sp. TaxID=1871063 RepID=UPI0039E71287
MRAAWGRTAAVVLAPVVAGVVGAFAWSRLAEPPVWTVADGQLEMGEAAMAAEFGVAVDFALVGAVGGLLLGLLLAATARRAAWPLVPMALAGGAAAALVAWQLGVVWGPGDPSEAAGLAVGDTVPDRLAVGAPAAFFAWPIATVAGLLPGVMVNPRAREQAREAALSA